MTKQFFIREDSMRKCYVLQTKSQELWID